jgi:YHS domain-containing protein
MKKILITLVIIAMGVTFSSCMMMMPCHMSDSMSESHNHDSLTVKIDPVCGKQVGKDSLFTYEYKANTYYFDTEQCLSVFKSNPDHFMQKPMNDTHKKTWTKVGWIGGAVVMTTMMVIMLVRIL